MAFSTLAQLRARLNLDLGIATDSDTEPWGSTDIRNAAIRDGFERLWPSMKRMREERPTLNDQQEYDLTTIRDVQLVEKEASNHTYADVKNYRFWVVDDDPVKARLRMAWPLDISGETSLVVHGYAPYISDLTSDSDACDIEERYEWIPLLGAKSFLYRRRYHEFLDYEKHANLNRANAMDPPTLFAAYQDMERRFLEARREHAASVTIPRRAKMGR